MNSNRLLKIICSLPVIVIISYFIPFLGVCLIITHFFVYNNQKDYFMPLSLIGIGILILIPKIITMIIKKGIKIPYLQTITNSEIYPELIKYSKFLISVGIIFLILASLFKNAVNKVTNFIRSYFSNRDRIASEVSQKNDLEIKIKQEKAKNTNVVICSNCGADNILAEATGICKYCRSSLDNKPDNN